MRNTLQATETQDLAYRQWDSLLLIKNKLHIPCLMTSPGCEVMTSSCLSRVLITLRNPHSASDSSISWEVTPIAKYGYGKLQLIRTHSLTVFIGEESSGKLRRRMGLLITLESMPTTGSGLNLNMNPCHWPCRYWCSWCDMDQQDRGLMAPPWCTYTEDSSLSML